MEEVGSLGEGQEEDLGPPHRPPNPKREGPEGVGHHWRLPHEEGGAADEVRTFLYAMASEASFNGMTLIEGALSPSEVAQRIKEAMEPSRDDAGAILDFVYPVPGHPLMRLEPGFIDFVISLSPCLLFN